MARYLMTWEIVENRLADNPETIATGWQGLLGMVKQDLETGKMKDWGAFPGEHAGFGIIEGDEMDVMKVTMRYAPYVSFKVRPVVNARGVGQFLASVAG